MLYENIREGEVINKIAEEYFSEFDCTKNIGDIDFCVTIKTDNYQLLETESLLWAEAKQGKSDVYKSIVQLVLTIGKARTFDNYLPPAFLAAFDAQKIAFIPYNEIQDVFYINDFNWNVTPSDHKTKEFEQVYEKVKTVIENKSLIFFWEEDSIEIQEFIKINFVLGKSETSKIQIDKNNFLVIYTKWLNEVKQTISANWEVAKRNGIIDGDFYLADLLSQENETLKNKLFVLLKKDHYELDRKLNKMEMFDQTTASFNDNQKAHTQFWNKYQRPPQKEYWDYIVKRRDLLVPQDVRERKGSFFTPQIWVELSQKYIADVLEKDWQDEYYVWDCAAGTGNLLAGLTNKYNIWASTLDRQDVDVMKDRIKNGANLLEDHVFQFDFLNDDFEKLPQGLQDIINNPEKRKKLVIYINPPYAEASSYGTESIPQVANETKIFNNFKSIVGAESMNELFAQFFIRIYKEIPNSTLATFSTPKYITSEKFTKFRTYFQAKYKKGFICKSDTFDNVNGRFPIGFYIWNLSNKKRTKKIKTDIFINDKEIKNILKKGKKNFYVINRDSITYWRKTFYCFDENPIGYTIIVGPSMQSNNNTFITNSPAESYTKKGMVANVTINNLTEMCIYLSVRQCIKQTWINNRDQFLSPKKGWKTDTEFQNNCLAYSLFHGQNKISSNGGTNHWIPFTEYDVDSRDKFESNFMTNFISGKIKKSKNDKIFEKSDKKQNTKLEFSPEAKEVFETGKALWQYYHKQPKCNVNASLYDIKEHFQGRNRSGRMNSKSKDEEYTKQLKELREKLQILSNKIKPKVYEYGFLKL